MLSFYLKAKGGDIITTAQYMNYQTFSNLQFRPLLKNSFHSIHIDLRGDLYIYMYIDTYIDLFI